MTPPPQLRVALCQLDLTVGDLDGNVAQMSEAYRWAEEQGADVAVFPELAVTSYPPEDLLLKPGFVEHSQRAVQRLAEAVDGHCTAVVGWVEGHRVPGADPHDATDGPWNAAAVLHGGRVVGSYRKQALPNYSVFDEKRYFDPGATGQPLFRIGGVAVALTVCEDMWMVEATVPTAAQGAQVVLNLNASPFHRGKQRERQELLERHVRTGGCPVAYVNLVGGQDELVFDGGSMVMGADGSLLARCRRFVPDRAVLDVPVPEAAAQGGATLPVVEVSGVTSDRQPLPAAVVEPDSEPLEEVWSALALGVRDYVAKNGFTDVVLGLSGGVDSSIVAAIAADALGPEHVHGVLMPSRYSSDHSISDAIGLAERLGMQHRTIPIEPAHAAFEEMLEESFGGRQSDLTDENLQSRLRGVTLMALSNKFGWLVLTTGNKTETAVGYSTLYGDTAGGLAVIKDVPKLLVYELCRWRNRREGAEVIPESVLTKAPSAELRPDQRDQDSLPPYEELDPIIEAYVDGDLTVAQLVEAGHDEAVVRRVGRLVDIAEYKRRQGAPGIRISQKSFGLDRRIPITNGYRGLAT